MAKTALDNALAFVNKFKGLLIGLGVIGASLLAINTAITDFARLPGTVKELETQASELEDQVKELKNVVQDFRMLLCAERAYREGTDPMECVDMWKEEEARK